MTYSTLQAAIASYCHRSDIAEVIPAFIANAEAFMFRELQSIELEDSVTGTITSNVITLPANFMSVQKLVIGTNSLAYESGTDVNSVVTSYPLTYTVESGAIKLIDPVEDGTTYTLYYAAKIPALSESNTTNWLLDNGRDLYLATAMMEAARYTKNTEMEAKWSVLVPGLIESVRSFSSRKKFPVRGGLQIKPRRT